MTSLALASALVRISLIASLRTGVDSSAESSLRLRVAVQAEELPNTIKSRSPLPVSSWAISSIGPNSDCENVSITGRPFSRDTKWSPTLLPMSR